MTRASRRAGIAAALQRYERGNGALPGIVRPGHRDALIEQLVDSSRETLYFERLRNDRSGAGVADPSAESFHPLRAAIFQERHGNRDEAFWLVFLFIHFGKSRQSGWHLIADIYGRLDSGTLWSWNAVTADVNAFRQWLEANRDAIERLRPKRRFGNHRKYESLDPWTETGTGAVVASYVDWVGEAGHDARIAQATAGTTTATQRFSALYKSVRIVHRFGRTAAFDYCSKLTNLGLVAGEPSAACLAGATGPLAGARLLLSQPGQRLSPAALEAKLAPLRDELDVGFDILEDALCNWQKSPAEFKPFRG
jgi:hypothetical protein